MGAWIEIKDYRYADFEQMSLLSWERGLKYHIYYLIYYNYIVAPLVGAWIEIYVLCPVPKRFDVAPLVGAWIEMVKFTEKLIIRSVAPLVGAWIEII